jgi:hypothetical protein
VFLRSLGVKWCKLAYLSEISRSEAGSGLSMPTPRMRRELLGNMEKGTGCRFPLFRSARDLKTFPRSLAAPRRRCVSTDFVVSAFAEIRYRSDEGVIQGKPMMVTIDPMRRDELGHEPRPAASGCPEDRRRIPVRNAETQARRGRNGPVGASRRRPFSDAGRTPSLPAT